MLPIFFRFFLPKNTINEKGIIIDGMADINIRFCVSYCIVIVRFPVSFISHPFAKAFTL